MLGFMKMNTNIFISKMKISKCNIFIHKITAFLVIIISVIGAGNALLRYVGKYLHLNLSSNVFIELQWYLFSILFLLGGTYTFLKNKHIRVDLIYNTLPQKLKNKSDCIGNILFLVPSCFLMFYISFEYFYNALKILESSSDVDGLPRYIIKFFIPLSFLYLGLNALKITLKFKK